MRGNVDIVRYLPVDVTKEPIAIIEKFKLGIIDLEELDEKLVLDKAVVQKLVKANYSTFNLLSDDLKIDRYSIYERNSRTER